MFANQQADDATMCEHQVAAGHEAIQKIVHPGTQILNALPLRSRKRVKRSAVGGLLG